MTSKKRKGKKKEEEEEVESVAADVLKSTNTSGANTLLLFLLSNIHSKNGFLSLICFFVTSWRQLLSLNRYIGDINQRQKTISETNIVEYVEFLQRQKTISETNFVSDQRQKRQILSLIRDRRDKYQRLKTIIRDTKLYF
jgi:hypothetical protein